MSTEKLRCTCENEGQDKLHGKNIRIFNKTTKLNTYRCTVCAKEITKG